MPTYEPPIAPLTAYDQRKLEANLKEHSLVPLKRALERANTAFQNNAYELADRATLRAEALRRRRAKRAANGLENDDDEAERGMEQFVKRANETVGQFETGMRGLVDLEVEVEALETCLGELTRGESGGATQTQSMPTQTSYRNTQAQEENRDEDDQDQERAVGEAPSAMFKKRLGEQKAQWNEASLYDR